jgi:hypothetical protein
VRLQISQGFSTRELAVIEKLTAEHQVFLVEKWHEFFGR